MDQRDPYSNRYNQAISSGDKDNDNLWDDDEEIELGSDENELFLRDEYVRSSSNDVLPYRVGMPTNNHQNNQHHHTIGMSSNYNQRNGFHSKQQHRKSSGGSDSKIETFQVDDSGHDSPTPSSSIVYQMPNYDQFAGNLAPTSIYSVLVSFVIIFVILAVTIVPKIIPKNQEVYFDDDVIISGSYDGEDVIESSGGGSISIGEADLKPSVHTDARCKCICPPLLTPSATNDHSGSSGKNNTSSSKSSSATNQRRLYVGNSLPDQCNCNNIVKAHFRQDTMVSFKEFCARCECRYQNRNTTTIKRNVVFFIAVLIGLALYLLVQYLLKHLRITRRSLPPHLRWLSHQMTES